MGAVVMRRGRLTEPWLQRNRSRRVEAWIPIDEVDCKKTKAPQTLLSQPNNCIPLKTFG
jgi:hypothetical protein